MKKHKKIINRIIIIFGVAYGLIFTYYLNVGAGLSQAFRYSLSISPVKYAFNHTNQLLISPYTKIQQHFEAKERKAEYLRPAAEKSAEDIKKFTEMLIIIGIPYANEITPQELLNTLQIAESNGDITPIYYYLFYTTPYLRYNKYIPHSSEEQIHNPLYNKELAWQALENAAFKGSQNAQILLSHYYQYGELFDYKTNINAIEALAWKVNAIFQSNDIVTLNHQKLIKEEFIQNQIEQLKITDLEKAYTRIQEVNQLFPIQFFVDNQTTNYFKEQLPDLLETLDKAQNNDDKAIRYSIEIFTKGYLGTRDYDQAYFWLQKLSDVKNEDNMIAQIDFYATKGNEKKGLNPYYNPQKALTLLENAAMQLQSTKIHDIITSLYLSGEYLNLKILIDRPMSSAWHYIQYINEDGLMELRGETFNASQYINSFPKYPADKEYTEEVKAHMLKLINDYRELHNIPQL